MVKKRTSILTKKDDFLEKDEGEELTGELFDINTSRGLINITLDRIVPSPNQPRKTFYEQTISELAESIKQHGVLSPIIVRPSGSKYEIIAGERRFRAAGQAGLKEIPAIIKKASNGDARIISLIENIQREDLNDIDRASALRELKANLGVTWEEIAKRLGLSKQRILDLVGLLDLPDEIKEDIRQKKLSERHGRALRQLLDKAEVLREVFNFIKDKKLTGEQTQELVQTIKSKPRFTIEESFNNLKDSFKPKKEVKKEPAKIAISEGTRLVKMLSEIKLSKMKPSEREALKATLLVIKKKIEEFLGDS